MFACESKYFKCNKSGNIFDPEKSPLLSGKVGKKGAQLFLLPSPYLGSPCSSIFFFGGAWFQRGVNMRGRWINAVDEAKRLMSLSSDTMIME